MKWVVCTTLYAQSLSWKREKLKFRKGMSSACLSRMLLESVQDSKVGTEHYSRVCILKDRRARVGGDREI